MRNLYYNINIPYLKYCDRSKTPHNVLDISFASYIEEFLSISPFSNYIENKSKMEGKPLSLSMIHTPLFISYQSGSSNLKVNYRPNIEIFIARKSRAESLLLRKETYV